MPADMSQRMLPLLSDWNALLTSNNTQELQQALRVLGLKSVELTGIEQRAKTAEQRYQALCKAVCLLVNDINDCSHSSQILMRSVVTLLSKLQTAPAVPAQPSASNQADNGSLEFSRVSGDNIYGKSTQIWVFWHKPGSGAASQLYVMEDILNLLGTDPNAPAIHASKVLRQVGSLCASRVAFWLQLAVACCVWPLWMTVLHSASTRATKQLKCFSVLHNCLCEQSALVADGLAIIVLFAL